MQSYEYRVVPAPRRGEKARGLRSTPDRFAHALTLMMNELGAEGWEFLRADTLPCDERVGLTGSKTTFQAVLVFRRAIDAQAAAGSPLSLTNPVAAGQPAGQPGLGRGLRADRDDQAEPAANAPKLGPAARGFDDMAAE